MRIGKRWWVTGWFFAALFATVLAQASVSVYVYATSAQGLGVPVGTVLISATPYGLLFTPQLHGLTPGIHGFHVHEHPACGESGMAAGGHFDPEHVQRHSGPYSAHGHGGDLPPLYVAADGTAVVPVLAPRLHSIEDIRQRALMLHAGGDNFADEPQALGGGGSRVACGVIG